MKKIIVTTIIIFSIIYNSYAETEFQEEAKHDKSISINYILSNITLSAKYLGSKSLLTWRDNYLNGVQLNIQHGKNIFGIGYSSSFHGYHTDDDANNDEGIISVADSTTTLLGAKYERLGNENWFIPRLGWDFNMVNFKNYNSRDSRLRFSPERAYEGLINKYDLYKFGFYGGMQAGFEKKVFYAVISGHAGIGLHFVIADWILREDFRHPVSFMDIGFSFRGGGSLETGLKAGNAVFFIKSQIDYDISPGLTYDIQFHSPKGRGWQYVFFDFSHSSVCTGIKLHF